MKTKRRLYVILRHNGKFNMRVVENYLKKFIYDNNLFIRKENDNRVIIKIDNIDKMKFNVYEVIKKMPNIQLKRASIFEKSILV